MNLSKTDVYFSIECTPMDGIQGVSMYASSLYDCKQHVVKIKVCNGIEWSGYDFVISPEDDMFKFDRLMDIAKTSLREHLQKKWHPEQGPSIESIAKDAQKLATSLAEKVKKN